MVNDVKKHKEGQKFNLSTQKGYLKAVGLSLKNNREKKGLTQEALAERIQIINKKELLSKSAISRYEKGKVEMSAIRLNNFCLSLELTIFDFFDDLFKNYSDSNDLKKKWDDQTNKRQFFNDQNDSENLIKSGLETLRKESGIEIEEIEIFSSDIFGTELDYTNILRFNIKPAKKYYSNIGIYNFFILFCALTLSEFLENDSNKEIKNSEVSVKQSNKMQIFETKRRRK